MDILERVLHQYDLPEIKTHWTNQGVFQLQAEFVAGSICWELYHGEKLVGTFLNPFQAAADLSAGKLDQEIGFPTTGLRIPEDFWDWNDLE